MSEITVVESQDPLFAKYNIAVEFEERLRRIEAQLLTCSVNDDGATIVKRLEDGFTVCALELSADRATLDIIPSGRMAGTGEQVYEYVYQIPYQGDPELWWLRPSCPPRFEDPTEGEIRRGKVTIAFFVASAEEAEGFFRTALAQIESVLRAQSREIEAFNQMLPRFVWQRLIHHRTGFSVPDADATRH